MLPPDTKDRILDAAERLFARHGFHNTSLRAITSEAGANVAAVNYHFGSKDALIEAVFGRRLEPLNRERMDRLRALRRTAADLGRAPAVEEVVRAFVEPTLRFRDTAPGAREFVFLVGRALFEPDDAIRSVFFRLMEPVFREFMAALGEGLPDLDPAELFWRMQLGMGATARAMCLPEEPELAPPQVRGPLEGEEAVRMLVSFVVAGLRAP